MNTISKFSDDVIAQICAINDTFVTKLVEQPVGQIANADGFEKRGLREELLNSPDERAKFHQRAVDKLRTCSSGAM